MLALAALILAAIAALVPRVGSEFMPRSHAHELTVRLALPEGTSLERTERVVAQLERLVRADLDAAVEQVYARVGPASGQDADGAALTGDNEAVVHLMLAPASPYTAAQLVGPIDAELARTPGLEATFELEQSALSQSLGRSGAPLVVELKGADLDELTRLSDAVLERLRALPLLTAVSSSLEAGQPELEVVVDRLAAAHWSLSAQDIGDQLGALLEGRPAGTMELRGEYAPIRIRRPRLSLDELGSALLETGDGQQLRLDQVATVQPATAPRAIERRNQSRVVSISAELAGDQPFDRVAARVNAALAQVDLPPAYSVTITGEERLRQESFRSLRFALILAVVLVYMVMAAQFESLLHPFVILLTIPLAGAGAVGLLLLLGMPFNVMSLIGIIMLAGIAVNDSIVLVDRINRNRRAGVELEEAIVEAARTRVRPIIMTSLTTMLALLPLAVGLGEGAALRAPLAVAVIGGLVTSTLLTLVVIPCAYRYVAVIDRLRPDPAAA